MADIIHLPVPPDADAQAKANTDRNALLLAWARKVLQDLGIAKAVAGARSFEQLHNITLDRYEADIAMAIRDALHPANGKRAEHFVGLRSGSLRRILDNQLHDLKRDRENTLRGRRRQPWEDKLILNKKGWPTACLANLVLILCNNPAWKSVFAFDDFNHRVVLRGRPPWGEERRNAPLTDHHEALVRVWFQREAKISPALGDVGRAVQAAARTNSFHPVRDYFNRLRWDGVPRLDRWLITYWHAEDTPYVRAVGKRWLLSSVARIYRPGCQVDHVIIFEGTQGLLKSAALRTLAVKDEWYSDRLSHLASKDALIETSGVLIIELSEMEALARASSGTAKSFITSQSDRFRPPHGKHTINLPRQCIFAGTINPPIGGYLKDPTGARRFWPVECIGMVDRGGLERDRDMLWAEAVARYKADEPWHLETPELEALATAEQEARYRTDIWQEPIVAWLRKRNRTDVTLWDVVKGALGYSRNEATQSIVNRVQKILTRIGFRQHRVRNQDRPGGREVRYRIDPIAAERFLRGKADHPDHAKSKKTRKTMKTTKTTRGRKRR
jgi:predicted P-loop ATPase